MLSVDYITPVVDDPYSFGAVAAANALSDVYAAGATPILALNLVGFPTKTLPLSLLGEIVRGGADKVREAGAWVVGGHSIEDYEPKYGLVVAGLAHPDALIGKATAQPGDLLVLTKPLGTGIVTTGIDRGVVGEDTVKEIVILMATLNRGAANAVRRVGARACTDVTGFGLLGHLHSLLSASQLAATIDLRAVPVLTQVWELARQNIVPAGSHANHLDAARFVRYGPGVPPEAELVLCDAQTSGGLLIAVSPDRADALVEALKVEQTPAAAIIGTVTAADPGTVAVQA